MTHEWMTLDELSLHLGRDRRELERLVNRGRVPGHKRGTDWQFHSAEITEWLEQEMRDFSDSQLAAVEVSQERESEPQTTPLLSDLMSQELVQVPLDGRTKRSVLEALVETAGRTWKIWEPAVVLKAVIEREAMMSTAFDAGIAIPHPRQPLPDSLEDSVVAFGRTTSPLPFGATNNGGTDLYFLVVCRDTRTHLRALARIGRLIQSPGFVDHLRAADDSRAAYDLIREADALVN